MDQPLARRDALLIFRLTLIAKLVFLALSFLTLLGLGGSARMGLVLRAFPTLLLALLFLPPDLAKHREVWSSLDYDTRTVKDLGVRAWQDAAVESMPPGTVMLFKQLRKDRVLRPV